MISRADSPLESSTTVPEAAATTLAPILVATDASFPSDSAIRAADVLSASRGVPVVAVSVIPAVPLIAGGMAAGAPEVMVPVDPAISQALRNERRLRVRDQLARVGITDPWRVMVRHGVTALEISSVARELGAGLIIVGLTHHSLWDRVLGRENALAIVRGAPVPVLAVATDIDLDDQRVLVGIDFTAASRSAAAAAFEFARGEGKVQLLHVDDTGVGSGQSQWTGPERRGAGDFALLRTLIPAPAGVDVEYSTMTGDIAPCMISRAEDWDASLIVVATHGGGFLRRLVVGSVTTELLRRATRPVLVVPAPISGSRRQILGESRAEYA